MDLNYVAPDLVETDDIVKFCDFELWKQPQSINGPHMTASDVNQFYYILLPAIHDCFCEVKCIIHDNLAQKSREFPEFRTFYVKIRRLIHQCDCFKTILIEDERWEF
jgi:hypothetical protein